MEENNRKGPGVFYAVVGVATLVVAIIGATFAFFSASETNSDITGTTAAAGGMDLTVTPLTETGDDMVPLNVTVDDGNLDKVNQLSAALKNGCIDDNKNNVCQVYEITVKNNSSTATVTVQGTLTLTGTNTTNMKWQLLEANYASSGTAAGYATIVSQNAPGYLTVAGNSVGTVGGQVGNGPTRASNVMSALGTQTYYVMVWLEEMGAAQEDDDASGSFVGTVFFSAVDANGVQSGITASFASAL